MNENPIDKDKITENPHNLPYAHTVGGAVVKPEDKGKIKSRAMTAMVEQTDQQLAQIYRQMKLLAEQANDIKKRIEVSELIYNAELRFEPIIGHTYYLYEKEDGKHLLSVIGPHQWGRSKGYKEFISAAKLLADHTWQLLNEDAETI